MDRKEIVNSQDYKATKAAIQWWYSLPKKQRKATDIDAEPDIVDAYADGVIYGWNNPQWIPVEDRLPEEGQVVLIHTKGGSVSTACYTDSRFDITDLFQAINVTHWMVIVPPKKDE